MSIRCPKCGSKNVTVTITNKQSYSVGKGLAGTLLFGAGGAAMGVNGKNEEIKTYVCQECADAFKIQCLYTPEIERALRQNDVETLKKFKKVYPNIEWNETDEGEEMEAPEPIIKLSRAEEEYLKLENDVNKIKKYFKYRPYDMVLEDDLMKELDVSYSAIEAAMAIGILSSDIDDEGNLCCKYHTDETEIKENCTIYRKIKEEEEREEREEKARIAREAEEKKAEERKKAQAKRNSAGANAEDPALRESKIKELAVCREKNRKVMSLLSQFNGNVRFCSEFFAFIRKDGSLWSYQSPNNIDEWKDLVKIEDQFGYTSEGKLCAPNKDIYDRVRGVFYSYGDIKQILRVFDEEYNGYFVALRSNGRIVTIGESEKFNYVKQWENIDRLQKDTSGNTVFGIKKDGTIAFDPSIYANTQIVDWKNIVQIVANEMRVIGLCQDGTVEFYESDPNSTSKCIYDSIRNANDIIQLAEGSVAPLAALHKDGSITICISQGSKLEYIDDRARYVAICWSNRISLECKLIGVSFDGKIELCAYRTSERIRNFEEHLLKGTLGERLFNDADNLEEERRLYREEQKQIRLQKEKAEREKIQKQNYRRQNLCQYCGGNFKGFFVKKCSICGKEKDY